MRPSIRLNFTADLELVCVSVKNEGLRLMPRIEGTSTRAAASCRSTRCPKRKASRTRTRPVQRLHRGVPQPHPQAPLWRPKRVAALLPATLRSRHFSARAPNSPPPLAPSFRRRTPRTRRGHSASRIDTSARPCRLPSLRSLSVPCRITRMPVTMPA
jgi:hypothetical protein